MTNYFSKIRKVIVLFQLLIVSLFSFAQLPDAIVLSSSNNIEIKNEKLKRIVSNKILINNRAGEEFIKVTLPYSKLCKISKIEANISDVSGKIIKKLNSSDVSTRSFMADFSFYEDNLIKEFTLKHNVYPYILSYSYQEDEDQFLDIDYWSPVIKYNVPILNSTLTINTPIDYKILFSNRNIPKPAIDSVEKAKVYSWKTSFDAIAPSEIFSPSITQYFPVVRVIPKNFLFDKAGSFDSWISYGNWQYGINKNLSELPEFEKYKIYSLTKNSINTIDKIKILYHYLQDETRYINISIKTGGMKPYPASYVAENKYGDCKALTNYFMSVLKFIGINSYYSKVYAGSQILKIDRLLPSQQFNHVILCLPVENDTIWLDCTSKGPFGYLGTFTQGRDAFIVNENNSHFTQTPKLKLTDVCEYRKITVNHIRENESMAIFESKYKGEKFEYFLQVAQLANEAQKQQIIRKNTYGYEPEEFKITHPHRDSTYLFFNFQAKTGKLYQQYGNETIIRTIPFEIPEFKKPGIRKYPVQINFPIYKSDTQLFNIPNGLKISNHIKDTVLNSEFGKYTLSAKYHENQVEISKSFQLFEGNYDLVLYPLFFEYIKNVIDLENNTIIITSKP